LPDDDFIKFKDAFHQEFPDVDVAELEGGTLATEKYVKSLFNV
jgi:hypothetical protein